MIRTERLLLRTWRDHDAVPFAAISADPEVMRLIGGAGGPISRRVSDELLARIRAHWDDHGYGLFAVERSDTGALLGFVGLMIPAFLPEVLPAVEIGWRLKRAAWGQGYATEAARASLTHAFGSLALAQVISVIDPENGRSIRVAQRIGMARGRDRLHPKTRRRLAVYDISADDAGFFPAPLLRSENHCATVIDRRGSEAAKSEATGV